MESLMLVVDDAYCSKAADMQNDPWYLFPAMWTLSEVGTVCIVVVSPALQLQADQGF